MATRRNIHASPAPKEEPTSAPQANEPQPPVSLEMPPFVIFKLAAFTIAMLIFPIGSYYYTLDRFFGGNSAYAGGCAAVMANVVLMGYIIAAWWEDQKELAKSKKEL